MVSIGAHNHPRARLLATSYPTAVSAMRQNILKAIFDVVDTTGMPKIFASIFGQLNLEIGFDVYGLYPHGIHYDQKSFALYVLVDDEDGESLTLSLALAQALDHKLSFTEESRLDELDLEYGSLRNSVRENSLKLLTTN